MNVPTSVPSAVSVNPAGESATRPCAIGRCSRSSESRPATASPEARPSTRRSARSGEHQDQRARPRPPRSRPRPTRVHEHLRVLPAKERRPRGPPCRDPSFDPSFRLVEVAQPEEPRLAAITEPRPASSPDASSSTPDESERQPCGVDRASAASPRGRPSRRRLDVDRPPRDRVARQLEVSEGPRLDTRPHEQLEVGRRRRHEQERRPRKRSPTLLAPVGAARLRHPSRAASRCSHSSHRARRRRRAGARGGLRGGDRIAASRGCPSPRTIGQRAVAQRLE